MLRKLHFPQNKEKIDAIKPDRTSNDEAKKYLPKGTGVEGKSRGEKRDKMKTRKDGASLQSARGNSKTRKRGGGGGKKTLEKKSGEPGKKRR